MKTRILSLGAATILGLLAATTTMTYGQIPVETKTTIIKSTGTVAELAPDAMVVRVRTSSAPIHYTFTRTTTYVDENGNPVSIETVKTGVPVTVYYEKTGDNFIADKVVVKKSVSTTTDEAVPAPTAVSPAGPPSVDGVMADRGMDDIAITTPTSAGRLHYDTGDATAYVDENGNPVSRSSLKEGTPVTVFYERNGDSLKATRIVVRNPTPVETRTTTEQTTTVPAR